MDAAEILSQARALRLPPLHLPEDRPYTAGDFARQPAQAALRCLASLLQAAPPGAAAQPATTGDTWTALAQTLLVVTERQPGQPWSHPEEAAATEELTSGLLRITAAASLKSLVTVPPEDPRAHLLLATARSLAGQLRAGEWRRYPAAVSALCWLTETAHADVVTQALPELLPPALLLCDDWEVRHQERGARCLRSLVCCVPGATMRQYGRAEVMLAALLKMCASSELAVMTEVYPAAQIVLAVVEPPSTETGLPQHSAHFQRVLFRLGAESGTALRHFLLEELSALLGPMDLECVPWLRLILESLTMCVETAADWQTRTAVLEVVFRLTLVASPRLHAHDEALCYVLTRLGYDAAEPGVSAPAEFSGRLEQVMVACADAPGSSLRRRWRQLGTAAGDLPPALTRLLDSVCGLDRKDGEVESARMSET